MTLISSRAVELFKNAALGKSSEEQNSLWAKIENPTIEDIPGKLDKLVTIIYRMHPDELDGQTSIYFLK